MKVRVSQIPETDEKPSKVIRRRATQPDIPSEDNTPVQRKALDEGEEDDDKFIVKTMLYIPELGFSISLTAIETIDTSFRVYESINGTGDVKPQWGIILNKDMDKSIRFPRTNIDFWFNSEELRDSIYQKIISKLSGAGYNFVTTE